MFFEDFLPSEAYPISTFIIVFCSLATFYMGVKDKEANPDAKFIDYDLAIIFCPTLLLGVKFGAIFNKTFSNVFLTVFFAIFIVHNIYTMYYKYHIQKENE